jgi:hypothetical protein
MYGVNMMCVKHTLGTQVPSLPVKAGRFVYMYRWRFGLCAKDVMRLGLSLSLSLFLSLSLSLALTLECKIWWGTRGKG